MLIATDLLGSFPQKTNFLVVWQDNAQLQSKLQLVFNQTTYIYCLLLLFLQVAAVPYRVYPVFIFGDANFLLFYFIYFMCYYYFVLYSFSFPPYYEILMLSLLSPVLRGESCVLEVFMSENMKVLTKLEVIYSQVLCMPLSCLET